MVLRLAAHLGVRSPAEPLFAHSARSTDPVDQIDYAADQGFDGVGDNSLLLRSGGDQRRMGVALCRRRMTMGAFTLAPPEAPAFPWTEADIDVAAGLSEALRAAERVGGGLINVVVCAGVGERVDQLARARRNLARAAEVAGAAGHVLALEAVSPLRLPGALVLAAGEAGAMVRDIAHPALRLLLDTCHMHLAADDAAGLILAHRERLAGVQIADMPGRVEPGVGVLDLAAVVAALEAVGFEGLVEAELFPSRPGREGEQAALTALRDLLSGRSGKRDAA